MALEIDYIAHNNGFTKFDSKIKFIIAITLILTALIFNSPYISFLIFLIAFSLTLIAKVPKKFYLKFLSIPLGFSIITFVFMALFFGTGKIIFDFGYLNLVIREDSLNLAINTFLRILGSFTSLVFLTLTTPINEIFNILDKCKVPKIVLEIAMLMYTTIFIFFEQVSKMKDAQNTRLGYNSLKNSYKSLGILLVNLFFSSLERSEKLQISLDSRCFNGTFPVYKK